jgi:K+-transporting ATPase ATPase C chain
MIRMTRSALTLFVFFTVITGLVYPALVTGLAQLAFPWRANGSVVAVQGKPIGSPLIGQPFSDAAHFWGRPSATSPQPYNGLASGGSNLGPTNPAQLAAVKGNLDALHAADPGNKAPVPVDLVTASASGLDPEISLAAAEYQRDRIARSRHLDPQLVQQLIDAHASRPWLGVFGEARVNVFELNLALDKVEATPQD